MEGTADSGDTASEMPAQPSYWMLSFSVRIAATALSSATVVPNGLRLRRACASRLEVGYTGKLRAQPHSSVGFEQRADGRPICRWTRPVAIFQFYQRPVAIE